MVAWSPFYILTGVIFVWSIPWFKSLFAPEGPLSWLVFKMPIPGITDVVIPAGRDAAATTTWDWAPVSATSTAILIAVLISFFTTPALKSHQLWGELGATVRELWKAIALIALILIVANIANYSGGSASIGNALAAVGVIFPLFAPVIGWFGVFITGSVVNNNTLFAHLQTVTAHQIGVDSTLLVAANTAGGTVAKVVSPQSIAIAAGAVGADLAARRDPARRDQVQPLGMLAWVCVWVFVLSLLLPGSDRRSEPASNRRASEGADALRERASATSPPARVAAAGPAQDVIRRAWKSAITSFFISSIAWKAPGASMSSSMFSGTTCQLTPNRSTHQPHCSASGTDDRASHSRSISAWSAHSIDSETPGVKLSDCATAASIATNHWPARVTSANITAPATAGPDCCG